MTTPEPIPFFSAAQDFDARLGDHARVLHRDDRLCGLAGVATPTSSAGHALAGAKTNPKLTFQPDH
jgi:hypothetical protein